MNAEQIRFNAQKVSWRHQAVTRLPAEANLDLLDESLRQASSRVAEEDDDDPPDHTKPHEKGALYWCYFVYF